MPVRSPYRRAVKAGGARPGAVAAPARRLAAIMFTDMVGYSALAQADEAASLRVLERHNRMLRPIFTRHRGREVKTVGDAFLVEFDSALDAVTCALDVQQTLHDYNASAPEGWKIRVRVGLHVGDVVETGGDVLGDAVNIASRIEALAEPDGISLSQQVVDQVQNKVPTTFARLPPQELKNIQLPITVYRAIRPWAGETGPLEPTVGRHLAVLPLSNISPDPADSYFADGLTEELISVLSQVPNLGVIARTSVAPYKSQPKSIAQVGAELGVDTVLEGSVRKAGTRLRITLQLIDVASQRHIWANSYNREIDDVFSVQTDIADRTAEALRIELARREPTDGTGHRPSPNPAAYELYLRGLVAAGDFVGSDLSEAFRCFEEATRLDPTFADAFASWANLYVVVAGDSLPMAQVIPKARTLVARALELDSGSSEAHAALGNILFQYDHDWDRAEAEFRRALVLNPSNVVAHRFFALMLIALGRFDEAKELLRRALRLDPGGRHRLTTALAELWSGHGETALELAQLEIDRKPRAVDLHIMRGMYCVAAGRLDDARREASFPLEGGTDSDRFDHALLMALLGEPAEGRVVAAEAERGEAKSYTSGSHLAILYAAMGEGARALDLLERAYDDGDRLFWLYYRAVWFDGIRDDPRFTALIRRYRLPTAPTAASNRGERGPSAPTHRT